jgi:hypothetical protein
MAVAQMNLKSLRRAWAHAAAYAVCLSLLTVVGCGGFELPDPPDMSRLVREYQRPDGELDPANAEEVAEEIVDCVDRARVGAPIELTDSLVGSMQELGGGEAEGSNDEAESDLAEPFEYDDDMDVGAGEQTVSGNKIDIGARLKVHHICRGWEDKKRIDEEENGTAELNVALDRSGLLPTVWGQLDHCRIKRAETEVELTGEIRLHFGTTAPRVGLRALKNIGYFVQFVGNMKAMRGDEMIDVDADLSFWVLGKSRVHMKVNLPDGTNVVLVLDPETLRPIDAPMLEAGLRTRAAIWACQLDLDNKNGSCTETNTDTVVQW